MAKTPRKRAGKGKRLVVAVLADGPQASGKRRRKALDPLLRGAIRKPPRRANGTPSAILRLPRRAAER